MTTLGYNELVSNVSQQSIANLLKENQDYQVTIYEKNTSINLDEGYGVQLSVNSIKLLNEIGFEKLQNKLCSTGSGICTKMNDYFLIFAQRLKWVK